MGFNDYEIKGNETIIFLKTRKGETFETIIDTEDLERIMALNLHWHIRYAPNTGTYYAKATRRYTAENGKRKGESVYLHVEIMNPEHDKSIYIDHINHDTLINTKINLRRSQNKENLRHRKGANSNNNTGHRNVNYIEKTNEYWVQICKNKKHNKWVFPANKFKEACDFADLMREEMFGEFKGNS